MIMVWVMIVSAHCWALQGVWLARNEKLPGSILEWGSCDTIFHKQSLSGRSHHSKGWQGNIGHLAVLAGSKQHHSIRASCVCITTELAGRFDREAQGLPLPQPLPAPCLPCSALFASYLLFELYLLTSRRRNFLSKCWSCSLMYAWTY